MRKTIMVVLDGLRYDTARAVMGYMEHLVEKERAACYRVSSELPSLSRPLYEVLLTGTPPVENGITANHTVRLSNQRSVFHLAAERGLTTAAAAYHWVSELYNRAPFNPLTDRIQLDGTSPIQYGLFYFDDTYPDSHLFTDAEFLRQAYAPDFLYIHPMNIDDIGHKHGSDSAQYRQAAGTADAILAGVLPAWLEHGYRVIVTADHGMNEFGQHGGTGRGEREVPFYAIGPEFTPGVYEAPIPQLAVAPLVCGLLGIPGSPAMRPAALPGCSLQLAREGGAGE
ncbi:alkaline phosphatase family protein [Paenibacillus glycinis]|uniref:Nucleotide pyrophosphatase n=1 Tax=Paenibacillus glycinis TaxID=2697035 RepID=A0ABW9XJF0_9BACL|nr:alkaline phosphatase family protein [Paenibacillus glycinis]NBD22718.1 nucleotide pyrophosphatase [Paenibacillus glycinis]